MREHAIEPELLQPVPRPVVLRGARGVALSTGCLRLFFLPHIVVGLFLLLLAVHMTLVAAMGPVVRGRIIQRYATRNKTGINWHVRYAYRAADRRYEATSGTSAASRRRVGDLVRVRVSPILPALNSRIETAGVSRWSDLLPVAILAILWNAAVSAFFYMLYLAPYLQRSVCAYGNIAIATVLANKRVGSGRNARYRVQFEYTPESSGGARAGAVRDHSYIDHAPWRALRIGDRVTVLYRARPIPTGWYAGLESSANAVLYPFGKYRVVARET